MSASVSSSLNGSLVSSLAQILLVVPAVAAAVSLLLYIAQKSASTTCRTHRSTSVVSVISDFNLQVCSQPCYTLSPAESAIIVYLLSKVFLAMQPARQPVCGKV